MTVRQFIHSVLIALLIMVSPCGRADTHIATSPYIQAHASDLVKWQPWNQASLQQARNNQKLILLSSGYHACRYCYVMKRESFENPDVANFINEHFVPILIDREMHPVLDAQLQQFMQELSAPQGWPLNMILTPDRYPLTGRLYQQADVFLNFLEAIENKWQQDRDFVLRTAKAASDKIIANNQGQVLRFREDSIQHFFSALAQQTMQVADRDYGGFGRDAKYPMSPQLLALLKLQPQLNQPLTTHLKNTLDAMLKGGLHDVLEGGFFRYTTDRLWNTPHYEKMLYDNAQLALVYLEASQVFNEDKYLRAAESTLQFLQKKFLLSHGGFISSLSAVDHRGRDGGYYLWSEDELASLLTTEQFKEVKQHWQMINQEQSIYYLPVSNQAIDNLSESQSRLLDSAKNRLLQHLDKRQQPRDDKTIAGWNGLALLAFTQAAKLTDKETYRHTADKLFKFINTQMIVDGLLLHTARGGSADLSDYAYLSAGLTAYADLTGQQLHYNQSKQIIEQAWQVFYIDGFWRRSVDLDLLLPFTVYPMLLPDNELPSPSALLIQTSLDMNRYLNKQFIDKAKQALYIADNKMVEAPFFYATQITGLLENTQAVERINQ